MTPKMEEAIRAMLAHAPLKPIKTVVNPMVVPAGSMACAIIDGVVTMVFHSQAELDVWLDGQRELGLRG